jgi:hypothetical protein
MLNNPSSSELSISGSSLNTALMDLLMADDIQPGSEPSYQICKTIYTHHPLGAKMAEAPVSMAQSQERMLTVQDAPEEVLKAFKDEWLALGVDNLIHNHMSLSRVYGLATIVLGCEGQAADKPLDMTKIWDQQIYFNVYDPLNTAGSLVLSQVPTSPDFNKPMTVRTSGETFHRSRYQVVMNENPVYLQYTSSAFGFVGRSVYQRALYPLKSFIRSMIADDLIATKLALLIAKQEAPGSIIDKVMQRIASMKRGLLKNAQTGQVLSIGLNEEIETLNMQNVDGAGTFSRTNILKNVATAADMPAKLLENETMVAGFGEGVEDAKNIARYIERVRMWMDPDYKWFQNIVQYRSWNRPFFERIKKKYPERYGKVSYDEAFIEWRSNFAHQWPSLLIEPESEQIKVEDVKLQAILAVLQTLLPELDAANKALLIQSALANVSENKRMFAHEFNLDYDTLLEHLKENQEQSKLLAAGGGDEGDPDKGEDVGGGVGKKMGKFDALNASIRRLPARQVPKRVTHDRAN